MFTLEIKITLGTHVEVEQHNMQTSHFLSRFFPWHSIVHDLIEICY